MPGSPQKRQRRELAEEIARQLAGGVLPEATRAPARARAAVRPLQRPPAPGGQPIGPVTRQALDHAQADQLAALTAVLAPGVVCSVERLRPPWCAGWVEDVELEIGTVQELRSYLSDTWGGLRYRVTVMHGNQPLASGSVPIAGPPKDSGRIINRDKWEAALEGRAFEAPAPTAAAATSGLGALDVVKLVLDEARQSRNATLDAVREMTTKTAETTAGLVEQFAKQANANRQGSTFTAQVAELRAGLTAVEGLKNAVAETIPEAPGAVDDDEHPYTRQLVKTAMERFISQAVDKSVGPKPARRAAPAASVPGNGHAIPEAGKVRK